MTQRQKDNWKTAAVVIGIIGTLTGWGEKILGDRFGVESRLTKIETKIDGMTTTLSEIADQGKRIAVTESEVVAIKERLRSLEANYQGGRK